MYNTSPPQTVPTYLVDEFDDDELQDVTEGVHLVDAAAQVAEGAVLQARTAIHNYTRGDGPAAGSQPRFRLLLLTMLRHIKSLIPNYSPSH